jgi:hypothetical protein
MGTSVMIFAGPKDDRALVEYAASLGLRLVPPRLDQVGTVAFEEPSQGPFWYLSFLPVENLHPYGNPPVKVGSATDPLIEFIRSYYEPPYLVAGRVYWSTDVPDLARQTKPHFTKLARWIRKHWKRRKEDGYYIGPDAQRLVEEGKAQPVYFPPGIEIKTLKV